MVDMRARETSSGQSQQPPLAHLRLSSPQTSSVAMRANRFTPVQISPGDFQRLSELYLPLPPETDGSKQSVSDPSAPNPFEINSTDGMTARAPFFVKLSRFAGVSEALAEREPAGEIPSEAEGSLLRRSRGVRAASRNPERSRKNCDLPCVLPLPSTVGEPECSGSRTPATDPLHPNSNEIKVPSGVADRAPFLLRRVKQPPRVLAISRSVQNTTTRISDEETGSVRVSLLHATFLSLATKASGNQLLTRLFGNHLSLSGRCSLRLLRDSLCRQRVAAKHLHLVHDFVGD